MTPRKIKAVENILKPINTAAIIILGGYTLVWGMWVANPFWDVFTRAPLYSRMAVMMPESIWGTIAMLSGLAMIHGVIRHSYRSLMTGALVGYLHWLVIAIMYFWGDWQNTGGVTSAVISLYCAFIWINIRKNREVLNL